MDELTGHVERSIKLADLGVSNLSKDIFYLDGMSSPKVRAFLNNLCERKGTRYLEIGLWKGSTFISALYGNEQMVDLAIGIDGYTEFTDLGTVVNPINTMNNTLDQRRPPQQKHPYECCMENTDKFLRKFPNLYFYGHDCFSFLFLDTLKLRHAEARINVYLYDGGHSESSQYSGFTEYDFMLDDTFIAIVDDWNWEQVKIGTRRAFTDLKYKVLKEWDLPGKGNDVDGWWNGLYVAVVQKTRERQ
jgi:hypothetical protein